MIEHPQSRTHWQKVRRSSSSVVPSLSKLPPSINTNKLRFQKCILLLFKPFKSFDELYNGISWDETYKEFMEVTDYTQYIENIQEIHQGIEEKDDDDENNEEVEEIDDDDEYGDDSCDQTDDKGLDSQTTEALDQIRRTEWLNESISNHETVHRVFESRSEIWKEKLKKRNQHMLNNIDQDECEEPTSSDGIATHNDGNVNVELEITNLEEQRIRIERIRDEVSRDYTLNRKQKVAYEMITDNIIKRLLKEKTEQLIAYVGGPGGTGKSQVINAIVEFHKQMKVKHTLKMCALTGTAAKHIGGSTTHTLFSLSSKDNAKLQRKFEKVETVIVDEVSMIGCKHLLNISKALIIGKCSDSSVPFGGIDMIFFGDFMQFPPIKDSPLYCSWSKAKDTSTGQFGIDKNLGAHLWKQVNKIVFLDQQMRCTDQAYLNLLNRLREGKCTDVDVEMLRGRIVGQSVNITSIDDAPIITPGNELVMAINKLFIEHYSQHTRVYISTAIDYTGKKNNRKHIPKKVARHIKDWASTKTKGLPRELELFVGMPVNITYNIATELGITNGTAGVVRSIHFGNGEIISGDRGYHHLKHTPEYVIVELEGVNMKPLDGLPPNHVPIYLHSESFQVSMPGRKRSVNVNRRHFPIVPRFGCTAHKSQGQTLRKAIIDLVPITRRSNGIEFAYVPLSRVRRLEDLTILRHFDPAILKAKVKEGCEEMMKEYKERDLCKDM